MWTEADSAPTGRFRRAQRLLDSRDFRRVMRKGRRRAHPDLVVVTARSREARKVIKDSENDDLGSSSGTRLGITASRKVGNAVRRNRFKRLVREWFRHRQDLLGRDLDIVVIARRSGAQLGLRELDARLCGLLDVDVDGHVDRGRSLDSHRGFALAQDRVPGGRHEG